MMPRTILRTLPLFLVAALTLPVACVDNTATTHNQPRENDYQTPDDLDGDSQLLHYGACDASEVVCTRGTSVGSSVELEVQLLNSHGNPIENAFIEFSEERIDGAEGAQLSGLTSLTEANGVATTRLNVADDPSTALGTIDITARVRDDADIEERSFRIGISAKDAASYIIEFEHLGSSSPDRVRPLLLDSEISCDEARNEFFDGMGWPQAQVQLPPSAVLPDGSINNAILPGVSNNDSYTVLGVAEEQVGNQYIDVAFGCVDDAPPVIQGVDVRVQVPLNDHIPYLGYRYDMSHSFDLTGALPPAVVAILDLVSTLVNDPAVFILGCQEGMDACPDGDKDGLVKMLLDFGVLPDSVESAIDDFLSSWIFEPAFNWLNEQLESLLPDWANDTFIVAGDLIDMMENFTVNGWMYFDEQPHRTIVDNEVVGLLNSQHGNQGRQLWDELVFQWNLGCGDEDISSECGRVTLDTNDLGAGDNHIVEGFFDGRVHGANDLSINRHALTLHYGQLLIGIIEKIILPQIFGEGVDSIPALIENFFTCEELADGMVGEDSNFHSTVVNLCGQLINQATDALYGWVEETLVADGDDHFYLSTPEEQHCTLHQPDIYPSGSWIGAPLPYVERLGTSDDRCDWKVEIKLSGEEEAEPDFILEGEFDGQLDSDPTSG